MTQIKTKIPAEMEPAAVGGMVADSKYIIDRVKNKTQEEVNADTEERVSTLEASVGTGGSVDERIAVEKNRAEQAEGVLDGKVATEKQRAEGVEGGLNTRLQTVEQLAEISVGGGDIGIGTAADFESDDPSDLAKVPTVGAMLGGANDGVYDISARHNGTKYADLAAALGTDGANVPVGVRKGGMSIKFVQTSDNKYVQFRCMAQSFTTNTAQWQGVDDEPTAGSDNLVKSGGVEKQMGYLKSSMLYTELIDGEGGTSLVTSGIRLKLRANIPYTIVYHATSLTYTGLSVGSVFQITDITNNIELVNYSSSSSLSNIYGEKKYTPSSDCEVVIKTRYTGTLLIGCIDDNLRNLIEKDDADSIPYLFVNINKTSVPNINNTDHTIDLGENPTIITCDNYYALSVIFESDTDKYRKIPITISGNAENRLKLVFNKTTCIISPKVYNYVCSKDEFVFAFVWVDYNTRVLNRITWNIPQYKIDGDYINITKDSFNQLKERVLVDEAVIQGELLTNFSLIGTGDSSLVTKQFDGVTMESGEKYTIVFSTNGISSSRAELTYAALQINVGNNNLINYNGNQIQDINGKSIVVTAPASGVVKALYAFSSGEKLFVDIFKGELFGILPNLQKSEKCLQAIGDVRTIHTGTGSTDFNISEYTNIVFKKGFNYNLIVEFDNLHFSGASDAVSMIQVLIKTFAGITTQIANISKDYAGSYRSFVYSFTPSEDSYLRVLSKIGQNEIVSVYTSQNGLLPIIENRIENKVVGNGDAAFYNLDKMPAVLNAAGRYEFNIYGQNNTNIWPLMAIVTDIHSDYERLYRAIQYSNSVDEIDGLFALGDIFDTSTLAEEYDYQNTILPKTNKPLLTIMGNHEVLADGSRGIKGLTDTQIIDKFFTSSLDTFNGITRDSGKCYWYKDISKAVGGTTYKLRVIGLYQFEFNPERDASGMPVDSEFLSGKGKDTVVYNQEQIDWLINLLDNTDANTSVVILIHACPLPIADDTRLNVEWNNPHTSGAGYGSDMGRNDGNSNMSNNNLLPAIIQAWIDGDTVNESTTYISKPDYTVTAEHTFASAHPNKFMGWLAGHTHFDDIVQFTDYPSQKCYTFNCTSANHNIQGSDIIRSTKGKSQDCFTLVGFDMQQNKIKLVRIGADVTTNMKDRKYAIF